MHSLRSMAISSSCPDSSESLLARCAARPLMLSALHAHGIEIQEDAGALASLCRACGLEPNVLLAEVDAAEHRLTEPWRAQPLPALIEHVLLAYHQPFAAELRTSPEVPPVLGMGLQLAAKGPADFVDHR